MSTFKGINYKPRHERGGKGAIMVNIINKKTLREYLNEYNAVNIQLIIGENIINIATDVKGSHGIVEAFSDEKFTFQYYDEKNNFLSLSI